MHAFAHASNILLFASSAAKPVQSAKSERLYASTSEDPKFILALYAQVSGPFFASVRQFFEDHVLQAAQKYTGPKAHCDEHMSDFFDIIEDFHKRHLLQSKVFHIVKTPTHESPILHIAPTGRLNV